MFFELLYFNKHDKFHNMKFTHSKVPGNIQLEKVTC